MKAITGSPPKRVFGNNRRLITVEVSRKEQSEKMALIKKVDGFPCDVKVHPRFNCTKAITYVHEFDLENIAEFKQGLKVSYSITDIIPAPFMKTHLLKRKYSW